MTSDAEHRPMGSPRNGSVGLLDWEEEMRAIVVEPMKMPRVEEIGNTLQELQKAVGGSIEVVPAELGDDALVICNEEGKIMGLPYN